MFIKYPNLPYKKVTSVLADYRAKNAKLALESLGIKVYTTPKIDIAYPAISGHPDITFHLLDENYAVAAPQAYEYYCGLFGKKHIIKGIAAVENAYPGDAIYNAARIGDKVFHSGKITDIKLIEYCKEKSIGTVNVKQGYTKCSICVVSENAIITQDKGISDAAEKNGIDSLLIKPGYIRLCDFPYGFIGGAAGKISNNILAFNGNIEMHPEYDEIKRFCLKYGAEPVSLGDYTLEDIGSIIPIE